MLHNSSDAEINTIPFPGGYDGKNVSYIIGGFRWKAVYLDRNGYLITFTAMGDGRNQYDVRSRNWVDYLPGQRVSYDCGRCHTTGYSTEGHQNGLEGIIGTWRFEGIQCEACHGPGAAHASSSRETDIRISTNACLQCHGTEPLDIIPLTGLFLNEYTEANQLMKSRMKNFSCVVCHNPHLSSKRSIKQPCESCHQKIAEISPD
jgi:Cytochrome c3